MDEFAFRKAWEFAESADRAHSLDVLHAALAATLERFGVPRFSMLSLADNGAGARIPHIVMSHSDEWGPYYRERGFYNVDAAVHRALRQPFAFSWSELERQRLPKAARDLFGEIRNALPIKGGFNIPIHDRQGFAGIVALYQDEHELPPPTARALKIIGMIAHRRAMELYDPPAPEACPLTPRQREIVAFVAAGKSDWDISRILAIAEGTVNEHVECAKKTVHVKTRVQLVALAIRNGWIRS